MFSSLLGGSLTIWDLITAIVYLTRIYWILGMGVYSLKFLSSSFNEFTSYGKLSNYKRGLVHHKTAFGFFYFFAFVWNILVILFLFFMHDTYGISLYKTLPLSIVFQIQITRRAIECLLIHNFSDNYISLFQFMSGWSYYGAASFSVMELLSEDSPDLFSNIKFHQLIGLFLFLCGNYMQHSAHKSLAQLRNKKIHSKSTTNKNDNNTRQYFIPMGGWFNYISCPHYFAEIIIYLSLVIFTSGKNISVWLSALFVLLNISHSAIRTHQWYKETFGSSYPKDRAALIPFFV